jgi:redox-sensitive bicupin YhaK (pirin superfamily)
MLRRRPASERGIYDYGWLKTAHTFSFNEYHDPAHHKFRALRVMNEDHVAAGQGFGLHPHRDMEIVTVVLSGTLAHEDSLGHRQTLGPDEVQWMSAGSGIRHSEFNHSTDEPVHLYQIWLLPRDKSLEPAYDQRVFAAAARQNRWQLLAAPDSGNGANGEASEALPIRQDARVMRTTLSGGAGLAADIAPGRSAWVQVMRGAATVRGSSGEEVALATGDGLAVSDESQLTLRTNDGADVLLFDLA